MINAIVEKCEKFMSVSRTNIRILNPETGEMILLNKFDPPKFIEKEFQKNAHNLLSKYSLFDGKPVVLFRDGLLMSYLVVILRNKDAKPVLVSLGPFMDKELKPEDIKHLGHSIKLSSENILILHNYYNKLPLYSSEEISDIADILISILNNPLSPTELLSDVIRTRLPKENEFSHKFVQYDYVDENYKRENEVLHYIETGNVEALAALSNLSYDRVNIPRRTKYDPLRDTKNLTIVLNSISARTAIKGGLSLHLAHSISTKYAIAIERQISSEGCYSLASNLLREYAECVRNYSLDKYPQLIKDALIIIRKNIASHIGLNDIAAKLHVSREHLCREFKREMGQNLTDYINELKINESLDLVKSKKYSVSDIAFIFGYSSSTYYSIVFKKIMGVPPSRYQA